MHRKSLEAAEALKDDSGGSDRDDEHSKASDSSSTGNPSTKSTPNSKTKKSHGCLESLASPPTPATSLNSDNAVNHNSVTPNSSCASTSQVTSSPTSTPSANTHTSLPVHHLIESKSMLASPTHSTFHHDNDTEAFRWVNAADPLSFIRYLIYNLLQPSILHIFNQA